MQQYLQAIFEHPTQLLVVLDAVRDETGAVIDWRYRDANANSLKLLKTTREALIGQLLSRVLAERAPTLIALCAKVLADGEPYRYQSRFENTDFIICLFPAGENTVVSSGIDITSSTRAAEEREQVLAADRAEKEWLTAVLNSMNDEVYFADREQRYTYANPAVFREFNHRHVEGLKIEEIVANLEVLRPDGTPRPLEEAPPLRALQGEVIRGEEQIVRVPRTGELRHRQVSSAPVKNRHGEIIGSVSVVRDVTDQKRSEQKLLEADRRKDEFIAMLAHELRNPLVPIRTGVELLKSVPDRPELLDTIRPMMERQVGHMVRLIDDLLDVSRITSGKIELKRQVVTLSTVVGSAVEANRAAIAAGQLELAIELSEPYLIIEVDPTRFAQVISNLLQNAAKFTPRGGRIRISSSVQPGAGDAAPVLMLKVEDSGIGISPQMLPKVFDLFAQAGGPDHHRNSGLGIGLAIARRLVELHGGTLEAQSEGPGKGSAFTIRVPAPRNLRAHDAAQTHDEQTLAGIPILIVDDNRDAADVMAILIQSMGGSTHVVYSGFAALSALDTFKPAVVLLDIGMPEMNGYETCRRIRQSFGADIGLIALSGWGQEHDKKTATEAGFDAHLTKPADPVKLEQLIRSLSWRRPSAGTR